MKFLYHSFNFQNFKNTPDPESLSPGFGEIDATFFSFFDSLATQLFSRTNGGILAQSRTGDPGNRELLCSKSAGVFGLIGGFDEIVPKNQSFRNKQKINKHKNPHTFP